MRMFRRFICMLMVVLLLTASATAALATVSARELSSEDGGALASVGNTAVPEGLTYVISEDYSVVLPDDVVVEDVVCITGYSGSATKLEIPAEIEGYPVRVIDTYAFYGCSALTEVVLPDCLAIIRSNAFDSCTSLTSIDIPDNVTYIEDGVFRFTGLTEFHVPRYASVVWAGAFFGCENLEKITVDEYNSYYSVYDGAVFNASGSALQQYPPGKEDSLYIIPSGTTRVEDMAFAGCKNLTSVSVPTSVTSIGNWGFYECTKLSNVYYYGTKQQWEEIILSPYNECLTDATIHYLPSDVLSFSGASLTLEDNISISFKADEDLFAQAGYTNPYVVFEMNGEQFTVSDYYVADGKYVFDFEDISPSNMTDIVTAKLYADFEGVEYYSVAREYSVAEYCYNMLSKYSSDEYSELRTLLVDLLNYGAASQIYENHKVDNLANAQLTDEQRSWATESTDEYTSVTDTEYEVIDNPTCSFKGAGLNLQDSITIRYKIQADSVENLSVKVKVGEYEEIIPAEDMVESGDVWYVFFEGLNPYQLSEPVYATIYQGDTAVSNTLRYSVESYAYSKQNSSDENLVNLLDAMMTYGDSVNAYVY